MWSLPLKSSQQTVKSYQGKEREEIMSRLCYRNSALENYKLRYKIQGMIFIDFRLLNIQD